MDRHNVNKSDFSNLQFELHPLRPYYLGNKQRFSTPGASSYFQIIWFKNSGNHYLDYQKIPHKASTLFFINPNQVHQFCEGSSNEGFIIYFKDNLLSHFCTDILARFNVSIFNEIEKNYIELSQNHSVKIEAILKNIDEELDQKEENHKDIVTHLFLNLLYFIERIRNAQNKKVTNADSSKIVGFKKLIIEHIDQPLSIADYADKLNVTDKKLTLLTKQHTALTPGKLIKELKILEAKRLLSNHNISIKEVASSLGFDQQTYFTKFFKKETSMTPKQFQNQVH